MVPLKKQSHYCSLDLVFSKLRAIVLNTESRSLYAHSSLCFTGLLAV